MQLRNLRARAGLKMNGIRSTHKAFRSYRVHTLRIIIRRHRAGFYLHHKKGSPFRDYMHSRVGPMRQKFY